MSVSTRKGVSHNGRRVAVYQSPNMAVSRGNSNRKAELNGDVKKPSRRIMDPRDAKDREIRSTPKSERSRRISVATPCAPRAHVEPQVVPQRRKSAPAMPSSMSDLTPEEKVMIANRRLQQNSLKSEQQRPPPSVLKSKDPNQPKKNRRVSFFQQVEEVTLPSLAEEGDY